MNYWVVYDLVRRCWKAKLKTSRPNHVKQDLEAVEQFPDRLAWALRKAFRIEPDLHWRYWVEDVSRFGLKPIQDLRKESSILAR